MDFKIYFKGVGKAKEQDLSKFNKAGQKSSIGLPIHSKQLISIRTRKITMKNY